MRSDLFVGHRQARRYDITPSVVIDRCPLWVSSPFADLLTPCLSRIAAPRPDLKQVCRDGAAEAYRLATNVPFG